MNEEPTLLECVNQLNRMCLFPERFPQLTAEQIGQLRDAIVKLETPLPIPDPLMQLDAMWTVLCAAAQGPLTKEQWQTILDALQSLAEMDGLEDMVLCTGIPAGGFLSADALQNLLNSVQTALSKIQDHSGAGSLAREMT